MAVLRLVLVLVILSGLALFTLQNATPPIALVFLGRQTLTLPLSVWILGAIVTGAITTLLLNALFQLSNSAAVRRSRRVNSSTDPTPNPTPPRSPWQSNPSTSSYGAPSQSSYDETDSDFDDEEYSAADPDEPSDRPRYDSYDRTDYEVPQEPQRSYQSGSSYSYSYRDANTSGAGRAESVYDAEYRVIIPPQPPASATEDDDYGFEPGDEFEGFEEFEDSPPSRSERPRANDPIEEDDDDWGDRSWRDKGWGERPRSDW